MSTKIGPLAGKLAPADPKPDLAKLVDAYYKLPPDGGDAEAVLGEFARAGVDDEALATRLQREGAASFDKSWTHLLGRVAAERATPA